MRRLDQPADGQSAVPAKTVRELVDLIKANPGKYSFSSAGAGTQAHLAGEQFRIYLGLDLVHVPYTGGGPAAAAVVAGHTPIGFSSPQAAGQFVKEGTLRGLAVTSKTRSQLVPGVPTMIEALASGRELDVVSGRWIFIWEGPWEVARIEPIESEARVRALLERRPAPSTSAP
jgi:tripartite-type tricarboxylate transporter receptor subunit TctC